MKNGGIYEGVFKTYSPKVIFFSFLTLPSLERYKYCIIDASLNWFTRADSFLQTSVNVCFFQVCELPVVYGVFN